MSLETRLRKLEQADGAEYLHVIARLDDETNEQAISAAAIAPAPNDLVILLCQANATSPGFKRHYYSMQVQR